MVERHNSIEDTSAKQPVGTLPSFSTQSSSPFTASGTQGAVPSQMYVAPMFQQSYPNASVYSAQSMYQSGQNDFNYPTPMEYYWSSMQQPYNYMMGMSSYRYMLDQWFLFGETQMALYPMKVVIMVLTRISLKDICQYRLLKGDWLVCRKQEVKNIKTTNSPYR